MPPAPRLEAAALRLAASGEVRTLVSMVERWAQVGEPTPRAQLAQIQGLLDLCLMDRAWTRLQAFPDVEPWRRSRALLSSKMFMLRGWPRRARRVIDEALAVWPDDGELLALAAEADSPERRAALNDPHPDAPLAELLTVAKSWLCTGAYHKASRLLEQVHRRFPAEREPSDLLWAMKGEFELNGVTLQQLAASTAIGTLADLPEEGEPTDAVPMVELQPLDGSDVAGGAFPDLFGSRSRVAGRADDDDTAEVTQATQLAALGFDVSRVSRPSDDRDEDTQVLRIVGGERAMPLRPAPDVGPTTSPGIQDELEQEDEAVILLTRPADRQPPQEMRRAPTLPDPGPPRAAPSALSAPLAAPSAPPAAEPAWWAIPWWMIGVVLLFGALGAAFAALALMALGAKPS